MRILLLPKCDILPILLFVYPVAACLGIRIVYLGDMCFFRCILAMFVQYYTNTLRVFVTSHIYGYEQFTKFRRTVCVRNYIKAPSYKF